MARKPNQKLLEKYKALMLEAAGYEPEGGHSYADDILCELLDELGYSEITGIFNSMTKWYA